MQWFWDSAKYFYASLALIPVVPFILVYLGSSAVTGNRKKAIRNAMDVTTALLIGCVAVLFNLIFGSSFGFYGILLIMLIGGGLLGNLQYRSKGVLDIKRVTRAVWRVGFFAMGFFYILLMLIGIGKVFLVA
ncbi:DUF3397 domain-containing protein [Paenibacillaceae bacterium]|nr:DUF3397 domain-containing protein [Paenibacillaceae bacterium]